MANIALTNYCNLRCPYCFAHEFVSNDKNNITDENFDTAVSFLTAMGPTHVGLIGGEPLVHPRFASMLEKLISNPLITSITIYTNGILLDRYADIISHPKCSLLVNWNNSEIIGQENFERTRKNVDLLVQDYGMARRINLGLNLYDDAMDYGYMIELLHRYTMSTVRISLCVPDFSKEQTLDVMEYFQRRKPFLWKLYHDFDETGILPYLDCNRPPACIWTEEERQWLIDYANRYDWPDSSICSNKSACTPVIDIFPDLTAIRCFALGEFDKVDIREYANLNELVTYFMRKIDRPAFRIFATEKCENCTLRRTWQCCQGCMGFKCNEIPEHWIPDDLC